MSSFLDTDLRTVVLRTLSSRDVMAEKWFWPLLVVSIEENIRRGRGGYKETKREGEYLSSQIFRPSAPSNADFRRYLSLREFIAVPILENNSGKTRAVRYKTIRTKDCMYLERLINGMEVAFTENKINVDHSRFGKDQKVMRRQRFV